MPKPKEVRPIANEVEESEGETEPEAVLHIVGQPFAQDSRIFARIHTSIRYLLHLCLPTQICINKQASF